jgi:DNA-binding FadR family transcriptional regulator
MLLEIRGATLRDVYTARTIFEPPASRMAAERATPEQVDGLRRTLAEELEADDDRLRYPIVAWRFHTELAELSGNATLAILSAALQQISQTHATQALAMRWERAVWAKAYRAHERLVDLIAAGQGREAEAFWRRHMAAAGEQLLRDFGDLPVSELI